MFIDCHSVNMTRHSMFMDCHPMNTTRHPVNDFQPANREGRQEEGESRPFEALSASPIPKAGRLLRP